MDTDNATLPLLLKTAEHGPDATVDAFLAARAAASDTEGARRVDIAAGGAAYRLRDTHPQVAAALNSSFDRDYHDRVRADTAAKADRVRRSKRDVPGEVAELLESLAGHPARTRDIARILDLAEPQVSRALARLKEAGHAEACEPPAGDHDRRGSWHRAPAEPAGPGADQYAQAVAEAFAKVGAPVGDRVYTVRVGGGTPPRVTEQTHPDRP